MKSASASGVLLQCFLGACLLVGAALLPHAPVRPVLAGMAVAGVIEFAWFRLIARRKGGP